MDNLKLPCWPPVIGTWQKHIAGQWTRDTWQTWALTNNGRWHGARGRPGQGLVTGHIAAHRVFCGEMFTVYAVLVYTRCLHTSLDGGGGLGVSSGDQWAANQRPVLPLLTNQRRLLTTRRLSPDTPSLSPIAHLRRERLTQYDATYIGALRLSTDTDTDGRRNERTSLVTPRTSYGANFESETEK